MQNKFVIDELLENVSCSKLRLKFSFFFQKDVNFVNFYNGTPNVFVSADHSSKGGNLSPVHNAITTWIEVRQLNGSHFIS